MPRIRSITPDFWEDERFTNVSLPAWLLYIGMKNFACDDGVILANPIIIKSKVFPAREDIRKQQVSQWLQELVQNSILVPFEYQGKSYYIMDFSSERIDKPQKSKIPAEIIEAAYCIDKSLTILEDTTEDSGTVCEHSRLFTNVRECSRMFDSIPAGEDIGKESKGKDGDITRTRETLPCESENFKKFKNWIDVNAPNVARMKEPFTEQQFERIKQDFPIEVIENVLRSMHNYRELLKKYVSANLTFRKWAKKDMEDGKYNRKTTAGNTTTGKDSNVSDDYKRNILERILGSGSTSNV